MPVDHERIRRSRPDDAPALSALFQLVFGHERPERVWHWKFFGHPVGAWSWVFEADGEIVAHCGAIAVRFSSEGRAILALQLVDFMSNPRYPGGLGAGGVFARMTTTMFRDILSRTDAKLLYGFPGERHRLVGERVLGYTTAGAIGELRLQTRGDDVELRPLTPADLSRFSGIPSRFHAIRDESLLRWRYLEHPVARYEILEASGASQCSAIVRRQGDEVFLMETGGSFARNDINELTDRMSRLGGTVIGWCSPDHSITRIFTSAGFELHTRDHSLAAAWFLDQPDPSRRRFFSSEPPRGADFYISLGDYDVH